jgi:hypothetical protein
VSWFLVSLATGCIEYGPGESVDEQEHPLVRILFVVDNSQSMALTDPMPSGRVPAIEDVISKYSAGPDTEFAIIRFAGSAEMLETFTSSQDNLFEALELLEVVTGNTNIQHALEITETFLSEYMAVQDPEELSRTYFSVVVFTDGLPYPQGFEDGYNTTEGLRHGVDEIMHLLDVHSPAGLKVHFSYLVGGAVAYYHHEATELYSWLAAAGDGQYLEFDRGGRDGDIDFSSIDFLQGD